MQPSMRMCNGGSGGGRQEAELAHPTGIVFKAFIDLIGPCRHEVARRECATGEPPVGCNYRVRNNQEDRNGNCWIRREGSRMKRTCTWE